MSITLRHKKFPLLIIFRDPKENWDNIVKDRLLKDLAEKGFDSYVLEEQTKEEDETG